MNLFATQAQNYLQGILNNAKMINGNPIAKNASEMLNSGDGKGLEQMARNLCKERGLDADKLYNDLSKRFNQ